MTDRNTMLNALRATLEGIDGVRHVARQDVDEDLVADEQMPAILISEGNTTYSVANRHGPRKYYVTSVITLDIQVRTRRKNGKAQNNASEIREGLVDAIIATLVENATLDGACYDALFGDVRVSYPTTDAGYANALLTHTVRQEVTYDQRKKTVWQTLVSTLYKWTSSDRPTPNEPAPVELEF